MWIIFLVISIVILLLIIFLIILIINKKTKDYVINNSVAISKLLDINSRYSFQDCRWFKKEQKYDNENMYQEIKCEDYLIYELQFKDESLNEAMKISKHNIDLYDDYKIEVNSIKCFGQFDKVNSRILNKEKELFKDIIIDIEKYVIKIKVILHCTNINGELRKTREREFEYYEIKEILSRLQNKQGYYYLDKSIWDSICRVERGKVSNKMRFFIYNRDGNRCRICGKRTNLEIDHIKPIAKGGKSTPDNLQTLCRSCNKIKGSSY